jgi:hypothetical protein
VPHAAEQARSGGRIAIARFARRRERSLIFHDVAAFWLRRCTAEDNVRNA